MISGLIKIFSGIFDFTSYIAGYFKEKGIRKNQKDYDSLLEKYNNLLDTVKELKKECDSKEEAAKIENEVAQTAEDIPESLNKKTREISG